MTIKFLQCSVSLVSKSLLLLLLATQKIVTFHLVDDFLLRGRVVHRVSDRSSLPLIHASGSLFPCSARMVVGVARSMVTAVAAIA